MAGPNLQQPDTGKTQRALRARIGTKFRLPADVNRRDYLRGPAPIRRLGSKPQEPPPRLKWALEHRKIVQLRALGDLLRHDLRLLQMQACHGRSASYNELTPKHAPTPEAAAPRCAQIVAARTGCSEHTHSRAHDVRMGGRQKRRPRSRAGVARNSGLKWVRSDFNRTRCSRLDTVCVMLAKSGAISVRFRRVWCTSRCRASLADSATKSAYLGPMLFKSGSISAGAADEKPTASPRLEPEAHSVKFRALGTHLWRQNSARPAPDFPLAMRDSLIDFLRTPPADPPTHRCRCRCHVSQDNAAASVRKRHRPRQRRQIPDGEMRPWQRCPPARAHTHARALEGPEAPLETRRTARPHLGPPGGGQANTGEVPRSTSARPNLGKFRPTPGRC